jgi:crotonobetainyl-CoA:carnitine CoA-transferase CaiB-like acyl-CoA transferase
MPMMTPASLPLDGVRILAFTQLGAGPYGMTVLADLGAQIIKIEDPTSGGDEARNVPPYAEDGDSLYFQAFNRNAQSVTLNLRSAAGRHVLHRLVAVSDAVYANCRGDLPGKLGLTYADLRHVNPRIVCCSLSGFGRTGPRAAEPAYDYLLQGLAGYMSLTGEPDGPPTKCGVSVVDYSGGLMSIVGLLVAILRARATGVGGDVDVSLLDTAVSMLNYMASWNMTRGTPLTRIADSAHPGVVPSQIFPTRDGYVLVMCMKEKFWLRMVELIERPALARDPRFLTFADRLAHRAELIALLKARFADKATAEWLALLTGHVPCGPIANVDEAMRDEQVLARDMIVAFEHPRFGTVRQVGCAVKIDDVQPRYQPAPALGADTDRVLRDLLALSDDEIADLRQGGAI